MKTIITVVCGIAFIATTIYSILGILPAWTMFLPLVIGGKYSKQIHFHYIRESAP